MFDYTRFHKLITERELINDEWEVGLNDYYEKMSSFIAENIEDSIVFIGQKCTGNEFIWLSEVFEEIAKKSQSKEFIECLRYTVRKFPEENQKYNLTFFIDDAVTYIN